MKKTTRSGLAGLVLAAASIPVSAATVGSDFSLGSEDWTVTTFNDNGQPNFLSVRAAGLATNAVASGGDPDGYIRTADPDDGWTYFVAPDKFLGDQGDKIGGTLNFSLQHSGGTLVGNPPHAVLVGAGRVLVADAGGPPAITPDWTRYSLNLGSGSWFVGSLNGALATDEDLQLTLDALEGLFLAAEFVTPVVEINGLDSVSLAPVPLPAAAWSMLGALGVLAARRRRA